MGYNLFLMPLLVSFSIAVVLLALLIELGRKHKPDDIRRAKRHTHKPGVSRFGGVALIVAFVAAIIMDKHLVISAPLMGVLFASGAILLLGVIDDLKQISWKTQLLFQLAIVLLVYILGVRLHFVTNPFGGIVLFSSGIGYIVGFLISIAWVVFLMNAINWVDGVDGVVGGITLIGAVTIFFVSLRPEVNQPPVAIITTILAGGLAAFVIMNFYPAKILAGTSGSIFMGFILAIMAIFAGAKIATTLLVLAVPIIDALWVIGERLKAGDSIFSPDKRHLHFKLLELGWSSRKICFFYYGITTLVAIVALNTSALGKAISLVAVAVIMVAVLLLIRRKIFYAQEIQ